MGHVFDRDKFRVMLHNHGYTSRDFAKLIGVSPSTISHYLTGRNAPSFVQAKKIADVLFVDIGELMTGYIPPVATEREPTKTKEDVAPVETKTPRQAKEEVLIASMQTATELLRVAIDILKDSYNVQKG